ncbi:single-stranded DNA-binding protein [Enterococcus casseliflavus]|nr:single-stranded DNA-binding protein [Enterococcus casseliflavus]
MMNNTNLIGRLTKEPNFRYTSTGKAVANFTLAVNRNFTNDQGEREADFIPCVIWNKKAETLAEHVTKGSLIGVSGRLQTRNYEDTTGARIYVTEVVIETFSLLEPKAKTKERAAQQ